MRYIIYKDRKGEWRWTLRAANHRKIANAGEGYRRRRDCVKAIRLVSGSRPVELRGW